MLIRNKKTFTVGVVFAISFLTVLFLIFAPLFSGKNGLQVADDSFNKLAKGSSYFIPKVTESADKYVGTPLTASIKLDSEEDANNAAKLFTTAGAAVEVSGAEMKIQGDMGTVLKSAIQDADAMYQNNGEAVSGRYGLDPKLALKSWWTAFSKIEKGMKKDKLIAEAKMLSDVNKKALEPGYNFFGVEANKVKDHALLLTGLLVFYVFYTMWWGYAIFYMFDGIGLSMKKSKVKKEA